MRARLLLLGAAVLAAGAVVLALWPSARRGRFSGVLSTRRADALGAKALYEVLVAAGMKPARRTTDLELLGSRGALFVLAPEPPPAPIEGMPRAPTFSKAERREVGRWIEKEGGRLVLVAARTTGIHRDFGVRIVDEEQPAPRRRRRSLKGLERTIEELLSRKKSPRARARARARRPSRRTGPVTSTGASPLASGTRTLSAPRVYHLDVPGADPRTLFAHDGRAVVAVVPRGEGMAIFVSTPYLASNVGLTNADNLSLFFGLARILSAGGFLQFDEFHHGERQARGFVALLASSGLQFALGQAILVVLLGAWAARRMTRRRGREQEAARGAPERLAAMASLYERGAMARHVAQRLWQATLAAIAERLRLRGERTAARLARALEGRDQGDLAERLRELARQEDALASKLRPRELVAFARALSEIRRQVAAHGSKERMG